MQRPVLAAILSLVLLAAFAVGPCVAQSSSETLAPISNQGRTKQQPYVTAGDRTYLIGTQDGNFPDMGQHVPGEMGGLWLPPIKLIDAFRASIEEAGTDEEFRWQKARRWSLIRMATGSSMAGCWTLSMSSAFSSVRIAGPA